MDVYLLRRKILRDATIGMHGHYAFLHRFAKMTPNDFLKNKEIQMFCIIAYHRSIKTSKNTWSLESSWNLLQNLSNRDFLAQFIKKLWRNEHSWSELGGVTGSQKAADFGSLSRMEKNNLRSKKSTPRAYYSTSINVHEFPTMWCFYFLI